MGKFEKIFNDYKGLLVFYLLVAFLTFMITKKIDEMNSQANMDKVEIKQTYYA